MIAGGRPAMTRRHAQSECDGIEPCRIEPPTTAARRVSHPTFLAQSWQDLQKLSNISCAAYDLSRVSWLPGSEAQQKRRRFKCWSIDSSGIPGRGLSGWQ